MDSRGARGESVASMVERLQQARGPELAELVGALSDPRTLDGLTDSQRLEVVAASVRLDAWSAAMRGRAISAVHASVVAEVRADAEDLAARSERAVRADVTRERQFADRRVAMEVSLALGSSFAIADRELDLALSLQGCPRIARALAEGRLDLRQARTILDGLDALASGDLDETMRSKRRARMVSGFLGPDSDDAVDDASSEEPPLFRELARPDVTLWSLPPARMRAIIAREMAGMDPAFLAERAAAARAARRVDYEDHSDATSSLYLHTDTVQAAAAYRNVDDAARAARRAGDPRNLDQLRADITVGWLTEGAHGTLVVRPDRVGERGDDAAVAIHRPDSPLVHVTVAATTLLGADEEPATLHGPRGPVPVPAHLARELASRRGARWRRLLYDPATGIATDLAPVYRPRALAHAFVRARDGGQSRFPTSAATRLELDHVQPYRHLHPTAGGQTGPSNLVAAGKRDHQLKTDRLVTVTGDANARLTYTTPAGRTYVSYPAAFGHTRPPPF